MVLGTRRGSTPISPGIQPTGFASYDPITRRTVRFIETIVPTLKGDGITVPADRFYCYLGLAASSADLPDWFDNAGIGGDYQQYAGNNFYRNFLGGSGGAETLTSDFPFIWPDGYAGDSNSYTPKNTTVTSVSIYFMARFPKSGFDYDTGGIGASSGGFSSSSDDFIQVLRNGTNWELGTCDGSTISQSSASGGDGSFHEFRVKWSTSAVELYVDGTLTITKTTNMPTIPLAPRISATQTGTSDGDIDVVDYLIQWDI